MIVKGAIPPAISRFLSNMRQFCVFGIHPDISEAELRAVFGFSPAARTGSVAIYKESFETAGAVNDLGGLVKAGDIIWEGKDKDFTVEFLADWIKRHHEGEKILFGLTVYGAGKKPTARYKHLPIQLKKALKPLGKKVRWVTGERGEIRPVTLQKLKLTTEGYDFNIILDKSRIYVGRSTAVQNADAWSDRDFGRPFRDAKTGMLPPKLARIMVNLAVGEKPSKDARLLDPFCGGGTVIMEAAMRYPELSLIGSDIDEKQVRGAERNRQWLEKHGYISDKQSVSWIAASAQTIDRSIESPIRYIVTEGFLGRPLQGNEREAELARNMKEVETIWKESLPQLAKLQPKDGVMVCVWPEYRVGPNTVSINLNASVKSAGYDRIDKNKLLYGRADQHVLRRIAILKKARKD